MISANHDRRGFSKAEMAILFVSGLILGAMIWAQFQEPITLVKIARVRGDYRSLGMALEMYFVDNGSFPPATRVLAEQPDAALYPKPPAVASSTFRGGSLTTPIAYLTHYMEDPSATVKGTTYRYHTDGEGWIIGAWGRDYDQDTGGQLLWDGGIEKIYDSSLPDPGVPLLTGAGPRGAYTFDPTNGQISPGDVWRVRPSYPPPGT